MYLVRRAVPSGHLRRVVAPLEKACKAFSGTALTDCWPTLASISTMAAVMGTTEKRARVRLLSQCAQPLCRVPLPAVIVGGGGSLQQGGHTRAAETAFLGEVAV